MGKYPVISLTLKDIEGLNFNEALSNFVELIGHEANRFEFLLDSDRLSSTDKERYGSLIVLNNGKYSMDKRTLVNSLELLSSLLYKHYNQRVIILIDEYEAPLYKALNNGYYDEMVSLIMGMYANALKGNCIFRMNKAGMKLASVPAILFNNAISTIFSTTSIS